MKDAATWLLVAEVADSTVLQNSARRTGRAGARREPYMLNVRSSAKVGLEPEDGTTVKRGRQPRTQGQETLAGSGIVTVRAGSTAVVEGWITYRLCHKACGDGGVFDPEPILTDLLSHG